ncbi:MAG: hypothetical protein WA175_07120 [Candidatus Acidiferrales bacterium]
MNIFTSMRASRIAVVSVAVACLSFAVLATPKETMAQGMTTREVPRMIADPSAYVVDAGFRDLYELRFDAARAKFSSYQSLRPGDPLGKAAEAASYLYEEFNDKGVLTSAFFLNDAKFLRGVDGSVSANHNEPFLAANSAARDLARRILKSNPHDANGLLILTMADGMESNYDALIEKKQIAGLGLMRKAESEAKTLLAIDPNALDAYVALGMSNYVIGCLPGYKRAFLWFGGIHGDRTQGMEQLRLAAEHGHYLQPFAKIMLALTYEREHQNALAIPLLADLTIEFPDNPIFARELALIQQAHPAGH